MYNVQIIREEIVVLLIKSKKFAVTQNNFKYNK